jgi:hypothetical protein
MDDQRLTFNVISVLRSGGFSVLADGFVAPEQPDFTSIAAGLRRILEADAAR